MSCRRSPALVLVLTLGTVLGCSSDPGAPPPPPPPTATAVAFVSQPSNTISGVTIAPSVTVEIRDADGNLMNSTASVTVAIANNPNSGTVSGTLSAAAVAGVATFSDLTIDAVATGYTLAATSPGLSSATSAAFNIGGVPTQLAFVTQPASGQPRQPITMSVELRDAAGNVAPLAATFRQYHDSTARRKPSEHERRTLQAVRRPATDRRCGLNHQ